MSGITPPVVEFARIPASAPRVLANAATNRTPALAGSPQPVSSLLLFVVALTSSLLLYLSYFPVSWGVLGWVALAPLLLLVRARTDNFFRYFTVFVVALAFYWPALQWMRVADDRMYFTWGAVATACSLFYPLALFMIRYIDRRTRLPLVVSAPVVWTALEFLRANIFGGFGWYLLGHSQHDNLPMIQIADVTGAYGVSFVLAAVNALLVECLFAQGRFRRAFAEGPALPRYGRIALASQLLAVFAAVVVTLSYGYWQLSHDTFRPGPRVALIQGNQDQQLRNNRDRSKEVADQYEALSQLASSEQYHADMIVWPETSFPYTWDIEADGAPAADCRAVAKAFADDWKKYLLLGLNVFEKRPDGSDWRYNSAVLVTPAGEAAGRYDKIHRVPFGEFVPLRDWVPGIDYFAPYDYDYSIQPGVGHTRFPMTELGGAHRPFTFGVVICYEDTDPIVARPYGGGDGQPPADFILNISNDGWFDGTSEHDEHLAICRFRAVECRRSVARAVNMGISAVIDADGRVLQPELLGIAQPTQPNGMTQAECPRVWYLSAEHRAEALPLSKWREYKKVQGVLLATIPLDDRTSFYAQWGDWLPWLCWLLLSPAICMLGARPPLAVWRWFRKTACEPRTE